MERLKRILIASTMAFMGITAYAQISPIENETLSLIDTNTIKLQSKIYNSNNKSINKYNFADTDVPVYSDSLIKYRLSVLESEISLDYNQYVKPYIDLYTIRRRTLSSKILAWSKYYFPMFEEALDRANMPLELKYLAVIESALNPLATSPVGAAGMWQFMAPTGRMYGLKTNAIYDERRDVQKSTEAAIKYLRNSYNLYKDWLLVIASYNCGPGNVNKAIRKAGGSKNFWEIQRFLPAETRGYVPAFIAATYMMNYSVEHNIYPAEISSINYFTDTIHVDASYNLTALADGLGMNKEELLDMNPALKRGVIPFGVDKVTLTVPYDKAILYASLNTDDFKKSANEKLIALNKQIAIEKKEKLASKSKHSKSSKHIVVKKGDTIGKIADRYNISVKKLQQINNLKSNRIHAGQRLFIKG